MAELEIVEWWLRDIEEEVVRSKIADVGRRLFLERWIVHHEVYLRCIAELDVVNLSCLVGLEWVRVVDGDQTLQIRLEVVGNFRIRNHFDARWAELFNDEGTTGDAGLWVRVVGRTMLRKCLGLQRHCEEKQTW